MPILTGLTCQSVCKALFCLRLFLVPPFQRSEGGGPRTRKRPSTHGRPPCHAAPPYTRGNNSSPPPESATFFRANVHSARRQQPSPVITPSHTRTPLPPNTPRLGVRVMDKVRGLTPDRRLLSPTRTHTHARSHALARRVAPEVRGAGHG